MKVKHNLSKNGLYFYFEGELDEYHSNAIKEKIDTLIENHKPVPSVVFNMRDLTFMDSTGIGIIIGRYKKLRNLKIPLYIENPSFSVDKVLTISGIYKVIPKL